jgi:hypothetical protein
MERRQLGQTGMTFGEQNLEAEAHGQLDYALGRGINFIEPPRWDEQAFVPRGDVRMRADESVPNGALMKYHHPKQRKCARPASFPRTCRRRPMGGGLP